ncbi:hypothetical protein J2129_000228 [Methanofollis sp. W23]|nr:hypothetical protein [Methanofollis sp. W23]
MKPHNFIEVAPLFSPDEYECNALLLISGVPTQDPLLKTEMTEQSQFSYSTPSSSQSRLLKIQIDFYSRHVVFQRLHTPVIDLTATNSRRHQAKGHDRCPYSHTPSILWNRILQPPSAKKIESTLYSTNNQSVSGMQNSRSFCLKNHNPAPRIAPAYDEPP